MQVSLETTSGLERKLTVEVPAEDVSSAIEEKLVTLSKQVKMSGFRPGKVPMRVVRQRYAKQVSQEVLADTMQKSYQQAVMQEKLRPAGSPSIEPVSMDAGKDLKYVATFEVYPEISLSDESAFEIEVADVEITDSDVDDIVEKLLKQKMTWKEVSRKSKTEDQVTLNFVGKVDGEAFEGGTADNFVTVVGAGNLLPEFEKQLEGVKVDEKKTFQLTFPEDYQQKDLAGKEATFDIEVLKIEEGEAPELTEDLIKEFGIEDGKEESLRKQLKDNMTLELDQRKNAFAKNSVMEALHASNEVEIPNALIQQEIQALRNQMMSNMQSTDQSKSAEEMLPDDLFTEEAKKRISLGLLISEVVHKNDIKLDQEKVTEYIQTMATGYGQPEEVMNYYRNNREAMANVEMAVMEQQVVDYIQGKAKQKSKKFSFDEFVNKQA